MRRQIGLAGVFAVTLTIIPALVAQAQSEEATSTELSPGETIEEIVSDIVNAATTSGEAATTTEDVAEESAPSVDEPTAEPAPESLEEAVETTEELMSEPYLEAASSTEETVTDPLSVASSTEPIASSTEPIAEEPPAEESKPKEDPLVLQPSAKMSTEYKAGDSMKIQIRLKNQTCRQCDRSTASTTVQAYYTAIYPNDGLESREVAEKVGLQVYEIDSVAPWESISLTWDGIAVASGRYYLVVIVDPDNTAGIHSVYRSEFSIQ